MVGLTTYYEMGSGGLLTRFKIILFDALILSRSLSGLVDFLRTTLIFYMLALGF